MYKNGMLIGVANSRRIVKMVGKKLYEKSDLDDFMNVYLLRKPTQRLQP